MSDLVYSLSLLIALASAGLALLLGIVAVSKSAAGAGSRRRRSFATRPRLILAALGALVVGACSLVVSVTVHSLWGHGPTGAEPMDVAQFLSAHEAFLWAALALVAGLVVVAYATRKRV